MKSHLQYLRYVLRHKWFVFVECLKLGVPIWIAVFHDWDKFMFDEWNPYVQYFYGEKVERPGVKVTTPNGGLVPLMEQPQHVKDAFDRAWNLHQKRNKHHWQFWLLHPDNPRPNFTFQSHDGGASHMQIRSVDGKDVAVVWDISIPWWKPDSEAERQCESDLRHAPVALPMPDVYRREMLADWRGAGRALGNSDTRQWYELNKHNIRLHPETRTWLEKEFEMQEQRDRTERAFKAGLYG